MKKDQYQRLSTAKTRRNAKEFNSISSFAFLRAFAVEMPFFHNS